MHIKLFIRKFPHVAHVVGRLVHAEHTDRHSGVYRCKRISTLDFPNPTVAWEEIDEGVC